MLSPEHDEHFNQPSTIVAGDDSGGVDGAKRFELGGTGGRAKGLGLGKAGDGFERVDGTGRLELGETGDGVRRLGLGKADNGGAGGGGAGDGEVVAEWVMAERVVAEGEMAREAILAPQKKTHPQG